MLQLTDREALTVFFFHPTLLQQQGSNWLWKSKSKIIYVKNLMKIQYDVTSENIDRTDLLLISPEIKEEVDDKFH